MNYNQNNIIILIIITNIMHTMINLHIIMHKLIMIQLIMQFMPIINKCLLSASNYANYAFNA